MDDERYPAPPSGGEIFGRVGCALPIIAAGLVACMFGGLWELVIINAATSPRGVFGPCDAFGTSAFFGGVVLLGLALLFVAGLILSPIVVRREHTSAGPKLAAFIFVVALISILYGYFSGARCPVMH